MNRTTDISFQANSTRTTLIQNSTESILLNKNRFYRKQNLINNKLVDVNETTSEEKIRYSNDRKIMQSLIHLLPPKLWAQIQNNYSAMHRNQSYYGQPLLPNPVLLAEAAAQAGLSGPGPYPIPEHLWPRIPPQIKTKPSTIRVPYQTKPTTTTFIPMKPITTSPSTLFSQIGFVCPSGVSGIRFPDRRLCNMYFTCTYSGLPEPSLCLEGYLFSEVSRDCELASHVNCGSRLSAFFEVDESKTISTTAQPKININNNTIECILGVDGYFKDPLFCNIYHHCIAGVDYIEHCSNQLAWNEQKKMCDW
jgi:hypothetical protein